MVNTHLVVTVFEGAASSEGCSLDKYCGRHVRTLFSDHCKHCLTFDVHV
jgi:hypothetical protein